MARDSQQPRAAFSARFRPETLAHLRERAERVGSTQTTLAERYVEEGIRMDEHSSIYFRDGAGGRRPALMGTRLDVWQVVETIRQNDNSVQEAAAYLRLPLSQVEACAAYYIDYQVEIDDWMDREREAADAAEDAWRRRQEMFA